MNPTQLEWAQTDVVCERYHDLFISSNRQKNDDCTVRTVLTWKLIVHVVQDVERCVGTDVGRYRWTIQGVTCGTTATVTRGTSVWLTWQVHTTDGNKLAWQVHLDVD
jgi:hypothetical protein